MFESMDKNFRQNLVNRVTKTNGPKMANRGRAILLRSESYQGLIKMGGGGFLSRKICLISYLTESPTFPQNLWKKSA